MKFKNSFTKIILSVLMLFTLNSVVFAQGQEQDKINKKPFLSLNGNDNIDDTQNFIGTINNQNLNFKTNNNLRMTLTKNGSLNLGNIISPDPNARLHIVPDKQFSVHKKGIFVDLPVLDQKGAFSAFYADGETNYSTIRGIFKGRIAHAKAYASDGDMIGGVYGYVKPSLITSNLIGYNALATGAACFADLDNLVVGNPGTAETWVGGVYGEITGTISNYPDIGHGAIAAIMGIDRIKGARTYAGYFDGNVDVIGNLKASDSLFANNISVNDMSVDSIKIGNSINIGPITPIALEDNIYTTPFGNDLFIQSSGINNNTIINANNYGKVSIGSQSTPAKLYVFQKQTIPSSVNPTLLVRSEGCIGTMGNPCPPNPIFAVEKKWKPSAPPTTLFAVLDTGNIGIGLAHPEERLHLLGIMRITGQRPVDDPGLVGLRMGSNGTEYSWIQSYSSPLVINPLGNYVIIGDKKITTGVHTDFKLAVDGKIVGKKIVATELNWADDEFDKQLTLDDLEEEEKYVNENGHLQGIPSGKEIEKNGIDLAEISSLKMRKIEQAYLYLFAMNKELKELRKENKQLKQEIKKLK